MNILVTGYAGFIGSQLVKKLLTDLKISKIYCIDNFNSYYDKNLKNNRVKDLKLKDLNNKLVEYKVDISNLTELKKIFKKNSFDAVIHLAAQAGIRYSFINPKSYLRAIFEVLTAIFFFTGLILMPMANMEIIF